MCLAVLFCAAVWADNDRIVSYQELPEAAQQTVARYFDKEKVMLVKEDREWFGKLYEVKFSDGTELEFLGDGQWKEIDCHHRAVPEELIPSQIAMYVKAHFPDRTVVKIERDRRGYEAELDNDVDLKFDLKFNLIDIDR